MTRVQLIGSLLIALGAGSSVLAADGTLRGTMLTDDFEPRAVQVVRLSTTGIDHIDTKTGKQSTTPLDRFLRIDAAAPPTPTPASPSAAKAAPAKEGFIFLFHDGQRWAGTPGELKGDDLEFIAAGGSGARLVPLKSLAGLVSLKSSAPTSSPSAAAADELLLANGDVATGVVSASSPTTVTLTSSDGSALPIEWANVHAVRFASTGTTANASPVAPFRVSLLDGRVVDGTSVELNEQGLRLRNADGIETVVSGSEVTSLEHRGGKARLLSNVAPETRAHEPYFPRQGAGSDASAAGNPAGNVTIGGRAIRAAVVARPHSIIRWPLDGSAKTFITRYGIPEGRPMADVIVRVKLDDKVVHERAHVKSGQLSELVRLPLGSAKSLTLEVDFGETYDVQDDLYWVEPALMSE